MPKQIPIALAEAALDAQAKAFENEKALTIHLSDEALDAKAIHLKSNSTEQSQQYISKATYEALWMLYQQALEEVQMLKQAHRQDQSAQLKITQEAALSLAELADKAFYYSREDRASADILIKAIRNICT